GGVWPIVAAVHDTAISAATARASIETVNRLRMKAPLSNALRRSKTRYLHPNAAAALGTLLTTRVANATIGQSRHLTFPGVKSGDATCAYFLRISSIRARYSRSCRSSPHWPTW